MRTIGKVLLGILAVLILVVGGIFIFGPDTIDVHIETEINAPADEVWKVLAHQFSEINQWSATVEKSWAVDASDVPAGFEVAPDAPVAGRVTISPVLEATEILTMYSDENKEFTFRAAGLPFFVNLIQNTQRVVPIDDENSMITFDVHMEPSGIFKVINPILASRFGGTFGQVQQDLKVYVESGQASE